MFEAEDETELVEAGRPVEDTPEVETDVVAAVAAVVFAAALSSLSFLDFFENRPAIVEFAPCLVVREARLSEGKGYESAREWGGEGGGDPTMGQTVRIR